MGSRRAEKGQAKTAANPRRGPRVPATLPGRHYMPAKQAPLWLRISALALAAVVVLGVGTAGLLFYKLQTNVTTAELNVGLGKTASGQPDAEQTGSLQILIIGTDTRDGANGAYGTAEDSTGEGNADVMLLMDISADNSRVSVSSFPRDLMVPIPDCKSADGATVIPGAVVGPLNASLQAGPGCTVAAINDVTGLTIDHFMLADFNAVKELSNALGGVDVCVDHAMYDVDGSWLRLPAGNSLVQGEDALAFLRTRHAFGDASDLARIKAQQYFLGSMIRKVKSEGTLTNLPKLYNLADVVTKNLTIDHGLANIPSMVGIATRLSKIDLAQVSFVTVPVVAYTADENKVQLQEPAAAQFFGALRNGQSLTPEPAAPSPGTDTPPAGTDPALPSDPVPSPETATPTYDKALQAVTVANASSLTGRTVELVQLLAANGFTNSWSVGDVPTQAETQLRYGIDMADAAKDVGALFQMPESAMVADPAVTGIRLVVGSDWVSGTEFGTVVVPENIVASTADESGQCLAVNPQFYSF